MLKIAKNKDGERDELELVFNGATQTLSPAPKDGKAVAAHYAAVGRKAKQCRAGEQLGFQDLPNDDSPMADASLNQESLSKEVDRALKQLLDREREILKMFFGIGCQEMTLEEIGQKFDLTRERVRQIKEKAIRRLKGQKSKLLKSYLGE